MQARVAHDVAQGRGCRSPALPPLAGRRAFSLFELMTVMAIMAMFAAIAIPRMGSASHRYRAELGARRLAADLEAASRYARSWSTPVTVVLDVSTNAYAISPFPDAKSGGSASKVAVGAGSSRASLVSADFDGDATVVFDALGMPDDPGHVVLGVGTWRYRVVLDGLGRARVTRDSAGTTITEEKVDKPSVGGGGK